MKRELDTDDIAEDEDANNEELGEKHLRIEEPESQDLLVGEPNVASVIAQQMDITEPLNSLRTSLEDRLGISLTDYEFFLQNEQQLDADKNLVNQCVQGEGMVQINVELIQPIGEKPRINIVDVLKPAEDEIEIPAGAITQAVEGLENKKMMVVSEDSSNVTRWTVSEEFRDNLIIRRTPQDPEKWTESDVKYWLNWAIKQFGVIGVDTSNFNMTGKKLCELTHDEFRTLVPHDDGDIFWTHLELLRKCKFVAVIQAQPQVYTVNEPKLRQYCKVGQSNKLRLCKTGYHTSSPGNRTGNNGQIQLWQFLLELLTDKDSRECIHWVGDDGEFKLSNPEMVAQLWGLRKNKPNMNYEKLSRALRYYYDGDMISKVHGNRFVYKFVCDLKQLIGYSAAELNRLVMDCEQKKIQRVKSTYSKKDESVIIPGSS